MMNEETAAIFEPWVEKILAAPPRPSAEWDRIAGRIDASLKKQLAERDRQAAKIIRTSLPPVLAWVGLRPRALRWIYRLGLARRPEMIEDALYPLYVVQDPGRQYGVPRSWEDVHGHTAPLSSS